MNFSKAMDAFITRKGRDMAIVKGRASDGTMETYRYRLEDFARHILETRGLGEGVEATREDPLAFEALLTELEVESLTADDVSNYLFDCLQDGISAPTLNARLYTLRSFLKELSKIDPAIKDITAEVPRSRYRYERKPSVTKDHMKKLIEHLRDGRKKSKNEFRNYVCFNLIRLFGLRISESLDLDVESLTITDTGLTLDILGKGNKKRVRTLPIRDGDGLVIPASSDFINDLGEFLETWRPQFKACPKNGGPLFLSQAGQRWNEDSARVAFQAAIRHCGLTEHRYTPHSLRHAFVSHKLADGVPLQTVSKLVDHANVQITSAIYAHSEERDLIEGMSRGLEPPPS